jgi:hypothetical protein
MTILKELTVATGKYTDSSGGEKTRWQTIGHLHDGKNGQYITLNPMMNLAAIPKKEGDDRVYVNMFDPKPKDGQKQAPKASQRAPQTADEDPDSSIPF